MKTILYLFLVNYCAAEAISKVQKILEHLDLVGLILVYYK